MCTFTNYRTGTEGEGPAKLKAFKIKIKQKQLHTNILVNNKQSYFRSFQSGFQSRSNSRKGYLHWYI